MMARSPSDTELAAVLNVPQSALAAVLDEVAGELSVWCTQQEGWMEPAEQPVTCTVLPTGQRTMALAFPDPSDLERYLPDTLLPNVDILALSFRELLNMLLAWPGMDLVILRPQDVQASPEGTLYVGIQIERPRLLASIIQRSLLEMGGTGMLLGSYLKWLNEQYPDAERLLVATVMARAAMQERLLSLSELAALCDVDLNTARRASSEASAYFTDWWNSCSEGDML